MEGEIDDLIEYPESPDPLRVAVYEHLYLPAFGFRFSVFSFRDPGFEFRAHSFGFRVPGVSGCRFSDFGFRIHDFWSRVHNFGVLVHNLGAGWGLGVFSGFTNLARSESEWATSAQAPGIGFRV